MHASVVLIIIPMRSRSQRRICRPRTGDRLSLSKHLLSGMPRYVTARRQPTQYQRDRRPGGPPVGVASISLCAEGRCNQSEELPHGEVAAIALAQFN